MSSTQGFFAMARLPRYGNNPPRRTFAIPKTIVCFGVSLSTRPYLGVGTGTSSFVPMFGEAIEGINITSPSAGSIKLKHTVDHLRLGTCFIRPRKCPTFRHRCKPCNGFVFLLGPVCRWCSNTRVISSLIRVTDLPYS